MRKTSLSKRTPSWRARTCDDDAVDAHGLARPGRTRSSATTSSSCRNEPGCTPTQNSSGVASSVPMTRRLHARASLRPPHVRPDAGWAHLPGTIGWMVRRGCDSVGDVDFLRTPDERFADLPGFPFEPNYVDVAAGDGSDDSLRVHYVDEGDRTSGETVLLMHGEPSWSYLYRKMIPVLVDAGYRCVAPDLIGFGRSDKPTPRGEYTYARHVEWMREALVRPARPERPHARRPGLGRTRSGSGWSPSTRTASLGSWPRTRSCRPATAIRARPSSRGSSTARRRPTSTSAAS